MHTTIERWRLGILSSEKRASFPVLTNLGFDLIGKNVLDGVRNGEVHARAIQALAETYAFSAASMMMDLSVESEAFGAPVRFSENEIPVVTGPCAPTAQAIDALKIPDMESGRLPEYLTAASIAAQTITDRPVFAGCIGPISLAGRLFGMSEIMVEMMLDPDTINMLLVKCTEFLIDYARAYKKLGVQGILVAEPAAGMLSPEMCDQFSSSFIKRIVDAVQDERFLVVLHNCGNTGALTASMVGTGAQAIHVGNKNPIIATLEEAPSGVLVMGNIDPAIIFKMATPDRVGEETAMLLAATAVYRNFIISSGCDIPPGTAKENIDAFYSAINGYNRVRGVAPVMSG